MKGVFSKGAVISVLVFVLQVALVYASSGEEAHGASKSDWIDFAWRMVNFIILVGFLWWLLAKRIKDYFAGRKATITSSLEEARVLKEEAERKYQEYTTKMDKATEEIGGIVELIKAQGMAERERILEDARKAAAKLEEDTRARMEQEFKLAKEELMKEAVKLAVEMAEELVKKNITVKDHENMVREYLDKAVIKS
ncbi:MAG TPA: ATP synthase F0 subunit B [Syntrophales bacterium]|nr:ATP synthase F0 subunit B [Syntrophales bacterium]HOL58697.1 ATP synthase F0 subunit B [Syntrophales bacterium]HPO35015.1 ATP synthase F0 subunit B [Syntrophales bacterium]